MFDWIKNIFRKNKLVNFNADIDEKSIDDQHNSDLDEEPVDGQATFIWCLIGNVVDENLVGTEKEIRHGTKHFSPNTKVYCFPTKWGDGYEKIKVIGRHRKTKRYVCMIIPAKLITNWRLQKVYRPYVLNVMQSQHGWTNSNNEKKTILEMLKWLPDRTIKIEK